MRKSFFTALLLLVCSALTAQQALTNDSIIKLVKAGLSDDLILSTINASAGTYDTSADGLIALKGAGVSDKVVAAVVVKGSGNVSAAASQPQGASNLAPAGHASIPPEGEPSKAIARSHQTGSSPAIFIKADPSFALALSAALNKKHDPVQLVTDEQRADYILQSATVSTHQESGASKIARCLFAYCAGIEGTSSVSVQLVRSSDATVVWAYQVRKGSGGPNGIQSLSEAIAKHLKNEFLSKQ